MGLHLFHPGFIIQRQRRAFVAGVVTAICLLGIQADRAGAEATANEKLSQIKAAFILNFIRLTEWPTKAFEEPTSPFVVAIVGGQDLAPSLDQTLKDQSTQGHPIVLRDYSVPTMEDADERREAEVQLVKALQKAHLVIFGAGPTERAAGLISSLDRRPLLTVGDGAKYIDHGAMLALQLEGDRMIFFASRDALGRGEVKVNANLLRLARLKSKDKR